MTSAESPTQKAPLGWFRRSLRCLRTGIRILFQVLLIAWATLAIYFSNLPWAWTHLVVASAFALFAVYALWIARPSKWRWAFAGAFTAVAVWWILIPPSFNRPWRGEVAVLPRAVIEGDRVKLINFRDFKYRSRHDFDVHYLDREVSLEHLVSLDVFISYWKVGPIGHTFLSFNFDDGSPPVCISIETRPEVGEGFDPLAALFKQFELIYVVGDERDLVLSRTHHRNEEVFLYHIRSNPETVRALFQIYLDRINQLAERPEWYHLLSDSCTLNIIRYSRSLGRKHSRFELRHYLNGFIDRYLYDRGIIDTSLEFDELRRRSHINEASHAAGDAEDFSKQIRANLPAPAQTQPE